MYYEAPGLGVAEAAERKDLVDFPLGVSFSAWDGSTDSDGDGEPDVTDPFPNNRDEWEDADGDALGDNFERLIIDYNPLDGIDTLEDVDGTDDFDGDGVTNADEFRYRTDPTDGATALTVAGPAVLAVLALAAVALGVRAARRKPRRPGTPPSTNR
jgi:hypothetical protein